MSVDKCLVLSGSNPTPVRSHKKFSTSLLRLRLVRLLMTRSRNRVCIIVDLVRDTGCSEDGPRDYGGGRLEVKERRSVEPEGVTTTLKQNK